ncbi:hypothetical protein N0V92_003426 [Colletotrichum tropicale]|nr:hypothetical protein N0V92_003426 [Colletotrichum tropicale]
MTDLDAAIENIQTAFLLTPEDYPHRMDGQGIIGDLLGLRYERTGNINDLNLAISSIQQGVSATSDIHPTLPSRLVSMGRLLFDRYDRKGDIHDLEDAIQTEERAISAAIRGDSDSGAYAAAQEYPNLSVWLATLGAHLSRRYEHTGKAEDFDAASLRIHQAISLTDEDDVNYPDMLDYLGNLSLSRHKKTGNMEDLDSAMQYSAKVLSARPVDSADHAVRLGNLSSRLISRYNCTGNAADLDAAIAKTRDAASDTAGHPDPAAMLNNLGTMLLSRYEHAGTLNDLEEAIFSSQRAIDLIPEDHSDLPGYLMALGNALSARYSRTGNTDDLNAAIFHIERAKSTVTEGHPLYVKVTYTLGHFLSNRYDRTREMLDLVNAISHMQAAVDRTSQSNPEYATYMNGLGCMLYSRYKHTAGDLEKAIATTQTAMALVPANQPEHRACLSNLGNMLEARFRSTMNMADFDKAISATREVLSATPKENPDFADWKYRLGRRLFQRIFVTINLQISGIVPGNFEEARQYMNKGFEADLQDPEKAEIFLTLVQPLRNALNHHEEAFPRPPLVQDLLETLHSFKEATESLTAIPRTRVRAARGAVMAFEFLQEWDRACEVAQEAVKILPLVCGRHLNRKDQQHAIQDTSGVAAIACSLSLKTGRVEQALQQVEFGRGLILGYLIDNNSDISILRRDNLVLANEFEELRSKATKPIPTADPAIQQRAIEERTAAVQQLKSCLESILQMPGHERFLLEPAVGELLEGAADGPIVVVNITSISSDAIIVSQSGIKSIALPKMTPDKASFLAQDFGRYSSVGQDDKDHDRDIQPETTSATKYSPEFLSWLWVGCVRPILAELPRNSSSLEELPRIWWIGTGVASSFPFHAAGNHYQSGNEDTLSRAIPSYTPTIKALLHARSSAVKPASNQDLKTSVLVVTMPETSGHTSLPGVTAEASIIRSVIEATCYFNRYLPQKHLQEI